MRSGRYGPVRLARARNATVVFVWQRFGRFGMAGNGLLRIGRARSGLAGSVRYGIAWFVTARFGELWQVWFGTVGFGS